MNLIVAADANWGIGKENKLLVSIPADMKFFRTTTTGKVVVMGKKTLESFPGKKRFRKHSAKSIWKQQRKLPGSSACGICQELS